MPAARVVLWGPILTGGRALPPSRIEVVDRRIASIQLTEHAPDADITVNDGWIAPGLVDLQVNGAGGADLTSAVDADQALAHVARTLAQHGVTSFCPTLVSSPQAAILARLPAYAPRPIPGAAECLGAHVEGPFISPEYRGVHEPRALRHATRAEIQDWLDTEPPRLVTLAPELPGGMQAIAQFRAHGVVVSLGHSGADAATAQHALEAGATAGTHVFNAMPPLHHRRPGLVGALLASQAVLGVIADGVHLDPLTLDLLVGRASTSRIALVSDALAAAGGPPGQSVLGDQTLTSDGRVVRREDGTLAGSAMLLDGCLRNARAWLQWLAPADVIHMATQTPADLIGAHRKGRVEPGADADLIVLDAHWNVRLTLVGGAAVSTTAAEVGV